jgi:hypothetical protein
MIALHLYPTSSTPPFIDKIKARVESVDVFFFLPQYGGLVREEPLVHRIALIYGINGMKSTLRYQDNIGEAPSKMERLIKNKKKFLSPSHITFHQDLDSNSGNHSR